MTRIKGYGLLAQQSLESLRVGARVEATKGKRTPFDFALWKKAKPGEPQWPSPFGPGRPAGTPSAWRWRWNCWGRVSRCMGAART